jgi:DNA-binding SARP family transcriptional activator/tetratricopeptide (TPR) repeat protein
LQLLADANYDLPITNDHFLITVLSIHLLGAPKILREQEPLTLSRRKSRALVYYLAAHHDPVSRDQLLGLFWPDLERPAAQQTLRTTLHGLRQVLGAAVNADDGSLALAPDEVEVDSRLFEASLAPSPAGPLPAPALAAALDRYQGDFLEGFSLPDAAAFEDWVAAERERLRRLAVRGLAALAHDYETQGDYALALATLDRALAFDQLQEDLQREALRLHYLAGDRTGAIRRYAHLRQLLDEEMGVLPMAETRAIYDGILNDKLPAAPSLLARAPAGPPPNQPVSNSQPPAAVARVPFAGRAPELNLLRGLLSTKTALSARKLVLVEGEPGIGKSRLVDEFMRGAGSLALSGAAHEMEQGLPYQPLIEALRCLLADPVWSALHAALQAQLPPVWLAEVARLLPELQPGVSPSSSGPDEPRLWEAVHQFLWAISRQHAITFFIDDLQWADASTLALLTYITRRARSESADILFLAAARPELRGSPLATFIQTLTREERLIRLPLARLDPDEVKHLAGQWAAGRVAEPNQISALADWLRSASEGNPYVLVELLRYACDQGLLSEAGRLDLAALGRGPVLPQTIFSLIESRLARLSEPARRVLDAAVAAGREFDFEVVYRAARLSEAAGLDALDELSAAGLVHPASSGGMPATQPGWPPLQRYVFDHSLTMEVAYREVGEPRHRLLHRRVGEAIEQVYGRQRSDEVAGVLAEHFAEGNQPERAAPYAFRAGQLAAKLAAWAEASAFFEQALAAEENPARRLATATALGNAHYSAGNMAQASEAYRLALELAFSTEDQALIESTQMALARAQLPQARFAEARRLARQILQTATSPETIAMAEFTLSTADSLEGADLRSAIEHVDAAEKQLRRAVEQGLMPPGQLGEYKFQRASIAAQQGNLSEAVALYREAMEIADHSDQPTALQFRILARNNLAYHMHLLKPGDPAALAYAEEGLRLAQEHGNLGVITYLYSTEGEIALAQGDLAAAERNFKEGLGLAERLNMPERVAGLTANLGLVAQARGETALALYRFSAAMAQADAVGTRHLAAQIRLWLAPLLPRAEGRARLAEVRAFAESAGRTRLLQEAAALERQMSEAAVP